MLCSRQVAPHGPLRTKSKTEKKINVPRRPCRELQAQNLPRLETHVDGDDFVPFPPPLPVKAESSAQMDTAQEPRAGGGLQRRPAAAAAARGGGAQEPPPRGQRAIHLDVDPPPRPRPGMQKLAIVAIVVLACLQFLPATHFRDPNDPHRGWISFDHSRNSAVRCFAPLSHSVLCVSFAFLDLELLNCVLLLLIPEYLI